MQRTGFVGDNYERPKKARFIAELDQRFFYFKDRRQPLLSNSTFNIRPIRWFGVNLITGYRYTLYDEAPTQRVTLNGL